MSSWPATLLCLLIGIAGWYYLFYSNAAHRLGAIEATASNRRRIRLRRTNGVAMLFLSALLYVGTRAIDAQRRPRLFFITWLAVIMLLVIVVTLAMIDVRLTMSLRMTPRQKDKP